MKHLFRFLRSKFAQAFLIRVSGASLLYGMNIVLARLMTPDAYGLVSFMLNITGLAMLVGPFGFNIASMRFVAAYRETDRYDVLRRYIKFALIVGGGAALLLASVIFVIGQFIPPALMAPGFAQAMVFAAPIALLLALIDLLAGIQRGHGEIMSALTPYAVIYPVTVLIVLAGLHLQGTQIDLSQAGLALLAGTSVALLYATFVLYQVIRCWPEPTDVTKYATPTNLDWLGTALSILPSKIASQAPRFLDVIILSFIITPADLGIYFLASRLVRLTSFGLQAAHLVVSPRFAAIMETARAMDDMELAQPENRQRMQAVMRRGLLGMLALTLPLMTVIALFGPWILNLAGPVFAAHGQILVLIFLAGEVTNVLCGPNGTFLNMTGVEKRLAVVSSVFLGIHLAMVVLGGYFGGMTGAALASSLVMATSNVTVSIIAWQARGINTTVLSLLTRGRAL